ncbi:hypothetical protein [uncultured Brachyspira sp.]|uniref:tetratricopeptide repeat protein n=1 Tax=uncultured Brachyspira sp. TaxID=221953 RepID=UPI00260D0E9F|nr:hypothetical protein [uncultured Brachyspira sp.]
MEQEHNFIKNEQNYEAPNEKSSSKGIMLILLLFISISAGICYWIYNKNSNYYNNYITNVYSNSAYTLSNFQISNKNDILNKYNIKKNLDYLMDIKYDEYANTFNSFINNNPLLNLDTRTLTIIFTAAVLTILASVFLFRGKELEASEGNIELNNNNDDSINNNNITDSRQTDIDDINNNGKIINTNYDGDKVVVNNYYKYNKNGDNVLWNVVKKDKNKLNDEEDTKKLSIMALKEIEEGNDEKAINIYTKILNNDNDNVPILKNRALVQSKRYQETSDNKYFDSALKDYNKIIDINTLREEDNTDALKDRAVLYSKKYHYTSDEKYFDLALEDYNKVIENNNNTDDLSTLLIYSDLYNEKYKNTQDKKYFDMSLDNYNKALNIDENNTSIYINRGWLYLIDYKISNDVQSLNHAKNDIEYGFSIEKDNFYLLNNNGIASLYKYKLEKQVKFLKESEFNFLKSIKNNKSASVLAESYYYLSLVYEEYSKLLTITAEKMKEYTEKSKYYLDEASKLGYKDALKTTN